jgi:hypothetical protein
MIFGPFESGDLRATTFENMRQGGFAIGPEGLVMKIRIPYGFPPNEQSDAMLAFDGMQAPRIKTCVADSPLLEIAVPMQMYMSMSRTTDAACAGYVGFDQYGTASIACDYAEAGAVLRVDLEQGEAFLDTSQPHTWSPSWRLELIHAHIRKPMVLVEHLSP